MKANYLGCEAIGHELEAIWMVHLETGREFSMDTHLLNLYQKCLKTHWAFARTSQRVLLHQHLVKNTITE